MSDHNITLFEACEILNISKKTISRYIRQGRLSPERVKSQQGTLKYRFARADLDALRASQAFQDTPPETDGRVETAAPEAQEGPKTGTQARPEAVSEATDETGQTGQGRQDTPAPSFEDSPYKTGQRGQTRQDIFRADRTDQTGHFEGQTGHESGLIALLRETTDLLKGQLTVKDGQINTLNDQVRDLIERDRETNILLKGLQDRLLYLAPPTPAADPAATTPAPGKPARSRRGFQIALLMILIATLGVYFYLNLMPVWGTVIEQGRILLNSTLGK